MEIDEHNSSAELTEDKTTPNVDSSRRAKSVDSAQQFSESIDMNDTQTTQLVAQNESNATATGQNEPVNS